jgi:type VI secretion system protein ImpG
MIEKYYEEEIRYLYESGRQFAKAHPDQARFLNIDAVGDRDPHVERLFEGFAFLAARIREKLDDSFPELSGGMIDLLWPHLQQEIPSLAIVDFKPREGYLSETKVLPRGTELLSKPVGADNVICTFSTTQPLTLNPIALTGVEKQVTTKGKGRSRSPSDSNRGSPGQRYALSRSGSTCMPKCRSLSRSMSS